MAEHVGYVVLYAGGLLLIVLVMGLFVGLVAEAWIWASDRWRDICRAESLIHEYRRERKEYLAWRKEHGYTTTGKENTDD